MFFLFDQALSFAHRCVRLSDLNACRTILLSTDIVLSTSAVDNAQQLHSIVLL